MSLKVYTLCGILGIWSKNKLPDTCKSQLERGLEIIKHRGPDYQSYKSYSNAILGHVRLSIIDPNPRSNQPFIDDKRYALVFNGEIFNYQSLKAKIKNVEFKTNSDTEILYYLLIQYGEEAIAWLDGFYAFAFYDVEKNDLLLARDRMGIKPLYFYENEDQLIFSSELDAFMAFDIDRSLCDSAVNYLFSTTYIPGPDSILKNGKKLLPNHLLKITNNKIHSSLIQRKLNTDVLNDFELAKKQLRSILKSSVQDRLVADVPLGCFLSGGLDSSIIAALAIQDKRDLQTFSIGFESAFFDESKYSNEVSKSIGSQHNEFILSKRDFKNNFQRFLETIDEPFADSSAFAMYLLAKETRKQVKVALSGDGADELFAGYRKHSAELQLRSLNSFKQAGIRALAGLSSILPINRSGKLGDTNRKLKKLKRGITLSNSERYWQWAQFISPDDRKRLLKRPIEKLENPLKIEFENEQDFLLADQQLVLPNDMLKKVDLMSMSHALEVRTPFLSTHLVDFANQLPMKFKHNRGVGKYILRETFKDILPDSVLNRSKKGFEIPIKEWLDAEIIEILNGPLFNVEYIENQGLFNHDFIKELIQEWSSYQFGDRIYLIWTLIVFQYWWDRHYNSF